MANMRAVSPFYNNNEEIRYENKIKKNDNNEEIRYENKNKKT